MKRLYGLLLALPLLLSLAPPAHAQLSGIWPRRFSNNQNQGRTKATGGVTGPRTTLSLAHTYTVNNCSAPVVDSNGTIYVTSSGTSVSNACALYAFTVNGSNQLVASWTKVLTGVGGRFLSAPTLSANYAYIAAGDISGGAGSNLIQVELGGSHTATSVNITTMLQTAANVPPLIDMNTGDVYVCSESYASGGGARVASYTSALGLNWKYSVQTADKTNVNDNNPYAGLRMVLKEGTPGMPYVPGSLHLHGYYLNYSEAPFPKYRHKVLGLNAGSGAEIYEDDQICDSTIGIPSSHPTLSNDGTNWYGTRIGVTSPGSGGISFFKRTTAAGTLTLASPSSLGSGSAGPNAASIIFGGSNVWSLFGTLRKFDAGLTLQNPTYSFTGTAAPSIDNAGYLFFVDGSGDIKVVDSTDGSQELSVAASAADEIAIISNTRLVVKEGSGLGLFVGT